MVNTRYWKIHSRARGDGQHRMSPLGRHRELVGSQVVNDCTGRAPGRFRATVVGASTDPRENPRQRGEGDTMECSKEVCRETAARVGGSMLRRASGRERLAGGSAGEIRRGEYQLFGLDFCELRWG